MKKLTFPLIENIFWGRQKIAEQDIFIYYDQPLFFARLDEQNNKYLFLLVDEDDVASRWAVVLIKENDYLELQKESSLANLSAKKYYSAPFTTTIFLVDHDDVQNQFTATYQVPVAEMPEEYLPDV